MRDCVSRGDIAVPSDLRTPLKGSASFLASFIDSFALWRNNDEEHISGGAGAGVAYARIAVDAMKSYLSAISRYYFRTAFTTH